MKAFLILEDGTVFEGRGIGADREVISEIVFNTSMTGYLEVLTDPSYAGQAVVMTYPLIGNYGVCYSDMESVKVWPDGYIVREIAGTYSNFRSRTGIEDLLKQYDIPGICGIDTRALTRILRERGTMNGMITRRADYNPEEVIRALKEYRVTKVVEKVTCGQKYVLKPEEFVPTDLERAFGTKLPDADSAHRYKVALMDFGTKKNIGHSLVKRGCEVTVYPAGTKAEEILADRPDGIMLSNGPGDPAECTDIIREIKTLYDSGVPIFAICLGHQLMALANGFRTSKMKYGHRGANHPVKDLTTGRVYLSSQNHGYMVTEESVDPAVAEVSFINANDKTVEGLRYKNKKVFTVQFHPEACAGPQDTGFLFDRFITMMEVQE